MSSIKYPIDSPHSFSKEEISKELSTNFETGLSANEVAERQQAFGKNLIEQKKKKHPLLILLAQFANPMVYMLLVAAGLSFFFKEWLEGYAILLVILINALIGFFMEYHAERSMEALKKMTQVIAKVIRDSKVIEIPSEEIVPGDILFLEAGDMIPADARIFNTSQAQANESALTGESMPLEKAEKILEKDTSLAERVNMLYKGTYVTKGNAKAIVTGTGMKTELGNIASMVDAAGKSVTPLEKKLQEFSKKLIMITIALVVIIFITGLLSGDKVLELLEKSIALAVAAIPEGLAIVATLALAQGMLKMAKHNVIVKKLEAVETLGGTNIICTDKTGTLTQNIIEVNTIVTGDGTMEIKLNPSARTMEIISKDNFSESKSFQLIKQISVLCNTAELTVNGNELKEVGDPLETGLLKFAYCNQIDIISYRNQFPKIKEVPFSSETRIMATMHKTNEKSFVAAKGAVEELIKCCSSILENEEVKTFDEALKTKWKNDSEKFSAAGLRIIAMAYKDADESTTDLTNNLVFVGLTGMLDPLREEVFAAIQECKSAGIKVVMITGDHPATAKNIALKLGLLESENEIVIHGKEMNDYKNLSSEEKKRWSESKVFARVSPRQKLDLVTLLQEDKSVVGMTGDGVNDAPALKKSDIGIAMGLRGTQVAQEVADMILKDDSFTSIVVAITQGRIIFENIRKFVVFLLSCNISELLIVFVASVFNFPFSLFALQILYINLATDVLPALALGVTEGSDSIMKQPPRNSNVPIIDRKLWKSIFVYSIVMAACTLGAVLFSHYTMHTSEQWNPELYNNILFITLILCQLWHVLNMTTDNSKSFFKSDVFRNKYVWYAIVICLVLTIGAYFVPPVAKVLSLIPPSWQDLAIMFGFSLLSLLLNQILKRVKIIL